MTGAREDATPTRVFVDTSFLFAVLDASDLNHGPAMALAHRLEAARSLSYTTWDIVSETSTLLLYRSSPK
ncbi:MAG: hypothetical protein HYZ53_28065, partial [Planctomycetes bacterium]|nr:hypothetical protein [Planctomycetota bacterium]